MNEIKEALIDTLNKFYELTKKQDSIENKLHLYQFIASCYWHNYSASYAHHQLEQDLLNLSENLMHIQAAENYQPNTILHIMTEADYVGGHTRIVDKWIKSSNDYAHSVIINNLSSNIPEFLHNSVKQTNGEIILNTRTTLLEKAKKILELAHKFEYVILHHHPHDILPLLALGNKHYQRPTFFYNHADHVWGCGYSVCDKILNFREDHLFNTHYRGIPKNDSLIAEIPIPDINITKTTLPKSLKKSIVTMASSYKYHPIDGYNFQNFIANLLQIDYNLDCHIIGVHNSDCHWQAVLQQFPTQIYLHGYLETHAAHKIISAASLYIDSFPLNSFTSLLEAISLGIPAVALHTPIGLPSYYKYLVVHDVEELLRQAQTILNFNQKQQEVYIVNIKNHITKYHSLNNFHKTIQQILKNTTKHQPTTLDHNLIKNDNYITEFADFIFNTHQQNHFKFDITLVNKLNLETKKAICNILHNSNILGQSLSMWGNLNLLEAIDHEVNCCELSITTEKNNTSDTFILKQLENSDSQYVYDVSMYDNITNIILYPSSQPTKLKILSANGVLLDGTKINLIVKDHNANYENHVYDFHNTKSYMIFTLPLIKIPNKIKNLQFTIYIQLYNKKNLIQMFEYNKKELDIKLTKHIRHVYNKIIGSAGIAVICSFLIKVLFEHLYSGRIK